MRLTVATYNIHGCVGFDRRHDPRRILEVLRELDADVVALQELEWNPDDALHLLDELSAALGCTGIPGPTLQRRTGHYGNAVLTRLPVASVNAVDLSIRGHEPRGAVDARLRAGDATIRVIATHLGLRPSERREQIRRLLELLPRDAGHPAIPVVLMGDINEWYLWGRPLRWLHAHFGKPSSPATFPSALPVLALDRIWTEPRSMCRQVRVHASRLARQASDHLPVVAMLECDSDAPQRHPQSHAAIAPG